MTSRFTTWPDGTPIIDPKAECIFCGETNCAAGWRGKTNVLVCSVCAGNTLPKLYADAVFNPHRPPDFGRTHITEFEAVFWRAYAIACVRDKK